MMMMLPAQKDLANKYRTDTGTRNTVPVRRLVFNVLLSFGERTGYAIDSRRF
jgi:hypothetical protein